MPKTGRPTRYSKGLAMQICKMIEEGNLRINDVCKKVSINIDTFYTWKKTRPDFSEMVRLAETKQLDGYAEDAMYSLRRLLKGEDTETIEIDYLPDAEGKPAIASQRIVKKKILPNAGIVSMTLRSLKPEIFKDRITHNIETTNVSDEELINRLMNAGQVDEISIEADRRKEEDSPDED